MSPDITATADDEIVAAVAEAEGSEGSVARRRDQRGMVSAEWTVGIIAAIAIAGVLLAVVTSGPVESLLLKVVLSIIKTFTRGL
jgi:hypothetical protein